MPDLTHNLISRRQNIYRLSVYLFFLASLAATIFAWYFTFQAINLQAEETSFRDSGNSLTWIQTRLDTYSDILTGAASFAENSIQVTRSEWENYIKRLQIVDRYSGLRTVIYVERVKSQDLENFVAHLKRENADIPAYQNYAVHPLSEIKAEYFPVKYTYGTNLEERYNALGLDVTFDQTRRETLERARDTNLLTISPPITLAVNAPEHGFVIAAPIYKVGLPTETVDERRLALQGFVYAPFDSNQFFDAILKPGWHDAFPSLDLEVYVDETTSPSDFLYDKNLSANLLRDPSAFRYTQKTTLRFGNQTWIILTGLPKTASANPLTSPVPLTILISGLLASFATFSFLHYQYHRLIQKTQNQS